MSTSEGEDEEDAPPHRHPLDDFLSLVQSDQSLATLLFAKDAKEKEPSRLALVDTCRHLFQVVEDLAKTLKDDGTATETSLSGLHELYLGDHDDAPTVDAETIWGQVDLQNEALHGMLKPLVRKLAKATTDTNQEEGGVIQLLDLNSEVFGEDHDEDNETEEEDNESDNTSEEEGGENDEEEDEVTRRIRERMERTLEDTDDEEDKESHEEEDGSDDGSQEDNRFFGNKKKNSNSKTPPNTPIKDIRKNEMEEDLIDPAAEELNNGFFDINEMEAFADEEEDMLPEQVWDPTPDPKSNKKKAEKKSFHQRQREGIDRDEEDDDDEEYDQLAQMETNTKRKKYREDDEIEALYGMYQDTSAMMEEAENEDLDDAVNMTAVDLFGEPNKKYFYKWKAQTKKQSSAETTQKDKDDDDDDSWNAYKFDDKNAGSGKDANDEESKDNEEKDGSNSDSDDDKGVEDGGKSGEGSKKEDADKKPKAKEASTQQKPKPKSKHALQVEKLRQETERLEKEMLSEKPWHMLGEAGAKARPLNSLLEVDPDFSVPGKVAPEITQEHTANIEDIIKKRILNEDWDDVIPRELPDVAWHKKRGELPEVSQEKAKLGLGELYEREYLKKAVGYDVDAAEKETEEDKAKNEMKQLFANICSKLDALSNYHFAPRPIAEEAEVRPATTPAIAMEEVLPLHVSNEQAAAPEEVYRKKRGREGILRNKTELDQTERKRIRSAKKAARRKSRQAKAADNKLIARVQPGLGLNNPYEKRKAKEVVSTARAEGRVKDGQADANSGYGSSNKFFRQMQDDVSKLLPDGKPKKETKERATIGRKSSSYKM